MLHIFPLTRKQVFNQRSLKMLAFSENRKLMMPFKGVFLCLRVSRFFNQLVFEDDDLLGGFPLLTRKQGFLIWVFPEENALYFGLRVSRVF